MTFLAAVSLYITYLFEGKCCSRLESLIIISQNFPFRTFFRYCLKSLLFLLVILAMIPLGSRISCTILKRGKNLRGYFQFYIGSLTSLWKNWTNILKNFIRKNFENFSDFFFFFKFFLPFLFQNHEFARIMNCEIMKCEGPLHKGMYMVIVQSCYSLYLNYRSVSNSYLKVSYSDLCTYQ